MYNRIKQIRNSLNLTQKSFGEKLGLRPSTINDIEHGRCKINERLFIAICSKFNVSEKWLRFGQDEMFIVKNLKYEEFFNIYNNLNPILQEFLLKTANNLLDTQNKLKDK